MLRPILLRTGSTNPQLSAQRGNYEQWFADALGWPMSRFELIDSTIEPELPDPRSVDGIIVTGSPLAVHDHPPGSDAAALWLAQAIAAGIPTLGVCYGHQLIGHALGGNVGLSPWGREMGVVEMTVDAEDPLFAGLPQSFPVYITHNDSVITAPKAAKVIAHTAMTPVSAMAVGDHCRTVQPHPEFDAHILRALIRSRADAIDTERGPGTAERMLEGVIGTHSGLVILRNFVEHFLKG